MKIILLFALLVCAYSSKGLNFNTYIHVKHKATWESYDFLENPFKDVHSDIIEGLFKVQLRSQEEIDHALKLLTVEPDMTEIPDSFDSRKQWPNCVRKITNQLHCGSCWAFSASSTLGDRVCIASGGKVNVDLSPQYMVSCDKNNKACQGGMLNYAWNFLEKEGITSEECTPYVSGDGKNVPTCPKECASKTAEFKKYKAIKGKSKALYRAADIQKELLANGPIQTGFMVYEDFMHYKGGVYKHDHGKLLGGHAVKIVGWDVENGQKHWIVGNSWGPEWGENGYFRIAFGQCSFDTNAYVGLAETTSSSKKLFSDIFDIIN